MTRPPKQPRRPRERLRAEAEARAAQATPPPAPARAAAELSHELQVHRIELEMQNEELRRAQVALEAARDRYVDLYDFAPVGYLTLGADGLIAEINLTGASLLGEPRARLVGSRFASHVAAADRERWHRYAMALLRHGDPSCTEVTLQAGDGRSFQAQVDAVRVTTPAALAVLRMTLTDISERRRANAELRLAATAFETQEGILITDAQGVIERVNRAFARITGYSAAEAVGHNASLLRSGRHDSGFYAAMWATLHRDGEWQGELWNRRRDGEVFPAWLTITAVREDGAEVTRFVGMMSDISQRKAREAEITQLAFYDPLTGLPNRRLMKDRLHHALALSERSGHEGALMFIDLDNFKTVNDTLGHDHGDLLLQQVAQRLTTCLREGDTVARPGGDEFIVVLTPDLSKATHEAAAQASVAAAKILAALGRPYQVAGREYQGGASIGIALFSGHAASMDELLRHADQAMYQAKSAGRNTWRFFDKLVQDALQRRSTMEVELRHALQLGEFVLHYQPEVDTDGRLRGAEVLLRWQHPQHGLMQPDEFIALAEQSGLIHSIGRWALQSACEQLAHWSTDPDLAAIDLSVNVSASQFRDPHFVQQVLATLDRCGADPARLKIELTESMMLDSVADTIDKMNALKARGVGFALDDFGTGYASLAYLRRLPIQQLKIDRTFVRDLLDDPHDAAIAQTIIDLGRRLGLTVVAEGVETAAQRDLLVRQGCHAFQGDLFGRPAPVHQLIEAAKRSRRQQAS
jgi:diguanylate cyclase (GGDEF)-like protein/PAS domain S-box-containing protein